MKPARRLAWCSIIGSFTFAWSGSALAKLHPGDVLAGVEFIVEGGPGRIYRINEGGDFTDALPDVQMAENAPVIDLCSTDDGRVLAATSTTRIIYDVTSGEPVVFATLPTDASGLFCGGETLYATSFLFDDALFDITAGGDVTTPIITGVNRATVKDRDGKLWAARFTGFELGGGGFRDIEPGDNLTLTAPHIDLTDLFAAVLHDGEVYAIASASDAVVDITRGTPQFAHAIAPGARGLMSNEGKLWTSTIEGLVYDVTDVKDYTGTPSFAQLPGPSLSIIVVQSCGDGAVHGREQCDDGGETAACYADCTLPRCGDGIVNEGLGEACDDGNTEANDGCAADCSAEPVATGSTTASTSAGTGGAGGAGGSAGDPGDEDEPRSDDGCSVSNAPAPGSFAFVLALGIAAAARRRALKQARVAGGQSNAGRRAPPRP